MEIRLKLQSGQIALQDALFYYEDTEALAAQARTILERPVTLTQQSSSKLRGSFCAQDGQLLMFTIPYDTGWQLYVDGQPWDYIPVLDALMAAQVPAGTHTYELHFAPRGGSVGCILTLTALMLCIGWYLLEKRKGADNGKKA